jgi:hypothetical protein
VLSIPLATGCTLHFSLFHVRLLPSSTHVPRSSLRFKTSTAPATITSCVNHAYVETPAVMSMLTPVELSAIQYTAAAVPAHETPADDDEDNHDDSPTSPSAVVSPAALQPRGGSPLLTISRPPERAPTAASGDVLLPLIICAVVRAAPPRLVAQLLVQRFRSRAAGGEAEYCLVNKMAVAEFLENVDLVVLGLTGPESQIAECVVRPLACALTVLMCVRSSVSAGLDPGAPPLSPPPAGRPGHVEQQVNALTVTTQKALTGVGAGGPDRRRPA